MQRTPPVQKEKKVRRDHDDHPEPHVEGKPETKKATKGPAPASEEKGDADAKHAGIRKRREQNRNAQDSIDDQGEDDAEARADRPAPTGRAKA